MNKNTSVETTSKGQATKVPTGKIKTKKSKEEIRKAREQEYENFRVNALKRRAKRMGMSDEQTNECIEKLKKQLKEPKQYSIHVIFRSGQKMKPSNKIKPIYQYEDGKVVKVGEKKQRVEGTPFSTLATEAIKNSKIECKMLTNSWALIEGDNKILDKLREILSGWATIHPYAKKAESVLPKAEPIKVKKPSNNNKDVAHAAKMARKEKNIRVHRNKKTGKIEHRKMSERKNRHSNHTGQGKSTAKKFKRGKLLKLKKFRKANIVHLKKTKRSTGSKKASTGLKQAA